MALRTRAEGEDWPHLCPKARGLPSLGTADAWSRPNRPQGVSLRSSYIAKIPVARRPRLPRNGSLPLSMLHADAAVGMVLAEWQADIAAAVCRSIKRERSERIGGGKAWHEPGVQLRTIDVMRQDDHILSRANRSAAR